MVWMGDFCLVIPWSGHGVTKEAYGFKIYKHRLSKKKHRHSRAGGNLLFLFVPAGCHFAQAS
jgi:hypothetical protein